MTSIPQNRTYYQDRVERGALISASGKVRKETATRWIVESDSTPGALYYVDASGCTCPDAKKRQGICKHSWASIGFSAAVAILALREVTDLNTAEQIMRGALPLVIDLPLGFRRTLKAEYDLAARGFDGWTGYAEWSQELEAASEPQAATSTPAPIYFHKECTHADCRTTQCSRDVRVGGIAI